MSSSKLPVWLIATMMLLSMGFVLYPQGSANAAKYCAQLRGATAAGHPDCSFSTLDKCRARVRHRGGGHCYRGEVEGPSGGVFLGARTQTAISPLGFSLGQERKKERPPAIKPGVV